MDVDDRDRSWAGPWLLPGETIVWSDRSASVRAPKADLVRAAGVTVGPLVFVSLWMPRFQRHADPVIARVALAVVALGVLQCLVMGYSLLIRKPRAARDRRYALTDERLLIGTIRPGVPAVSWYLDQLTPPRLALRADGTTSILLSSIDTQPWSFPTEFFNRARRPEAATLSGLAAPESFIAALATVASAPELSEPAAIPATAEPIAVPAGWAPSPGEQVLWTGRPARVPWWFGSADVQQALATAPFPLFIVVMAVWVLTHGGPPFFLVPCAVLFLALSHMCFGRVLWRRARIRRSVYVVTDERVLCLWNPRGLRSTEDYHEYLLPPQIRPDGSLYFHRHGPAPARVNGWPLLMHPAALGEPPNLIGLAEPRTVALIVARARAAVVAEASAAG